MPGRAQTAYYTDTLAGHYNCRCFTFLTPLLPDDKTRTVRQHPIVLSLSGDRTSHTYCEVRPQLLHCFLDALVDLWVMPLARLQKGR